jgi:hypothetical protein
MAAGRWLDDRWLDGRWLDGRWPLAAGRLPLAG